MTLTDDDYRELAAQCAVQDFGRIDRSWGSVYVRMDVFVDYEREDDYYNGTGGSIPVSAECRVIDFDYDTVDGSDVEFDASELEEMTYETLMRY